MRSRYAGFALGLGSYLVDTLATAHPDRGQPRETLVADLSKARAGQRFTGLQILSSAVAEELDRGQVFFHARIFVGTFANARDASFVELSDFVLEDGAWRYAGGVSASAKRFADQLSALTPTTFLARVAETDGQAHGR
jgi:SEC-C motif-containing protein